MLNRLFELRPAVRALQGIEKALVRLAQAYEADLQDRGVLARPASEGDKRLEVTYSDPEEEAVRELRRELVAAREEEAE